MNKSLKWGELIIKAFCRREDLQEKLGDFDELYRYRLKNHGQTKAAAWYFSQILRLIVSELQLSIYWGFAMFKNYLVIALRNLKRQKTYSFINISGLLLGITAFLLVSIWVLNELSFDRFHKNASSIYRVNERRIFPNNTEYSFRTPGPLAEILKINFFEVKETARVAWTGERVMRYKDKAYYENGILTVDPSFLKIFSFPLAKGNENKALDGLNSIVISSSTARKYFGTVDPIGKTLNMENQFDFTVTGVVKDVPSNSHLEFDMLVPYEIVKRLGWKNDVWDFSIGPTYLLLDKDKPVEDFENKIRGLVKEYDPETNIELYLQPLTKIHLYSNFDSSSGTEPIQYVYIFSFVGILILLIACINFMNLATARSEYRAKEIGVRKVIGAARTSLIRQFLIEAGIIASFALILSPFLLEFLLPGFNKLTGQNFSFSNLMDWRLILLTIGITFLAGLVSGSYPAFFLSSFQPVNVLKGNLTQGPKRSSLRKSLVLVQMSVSLMLIIVSLIVFRQIHYLKNKDLGFDKEHVVSIPLGIGNADNSLVYNRFREEISYNPKIEKTSASFTHLTWFATPTDPIFCKGNRLDKNIPISITSVDFDFTETLSIEIIKGRSFSRDYGSERRNLIVNEQFEKLLDGESALGQTIMIGDDYQGTIIGVSEDFHMESIATAPIRPLILFLNPIVNYIFIRIQQEDIAGTIEFLENAWRKAAPNMPFRYSFLDQEFNNLYTDVERLGTSLKYFTIMAGFIACLGLLGLASFTVEKRTKEIGVRKVLGSTAGHIVFLLCRDYVKLNLFANLIAWPMAWILMNKWLQNFAYHAEMQLTPFVLSGVLTLAITLLTISFLTIRASLADPVQSLRYE